MRAIIFLFLLVVFSNKIIAQGTWTQKADVPGVSSVRSEAVGFSIANFGYVGTGNGGGADFWQYDPATNVWTQKADFGGTARAAAVGFSIGYKGYVGTGYDGTYKKDFWGYDPTANVWTKKANFGGHSRDQAIGFSIGGKGYIGLGYYAPAQSGDTQYYNDLWEYDPLTDIWTKKANFISGRFRAAAFANGNKGFVGTGYGIGGLTKDFWQYDPIANSWIQKSDLPGLPRNLAVAFSIGGTGYCGIGADSTGFVQDFWAYDTLTNSWTQQADFGGGPRGFAIGFSMGNKGYVGTGAGDLIGFKDFWEFSPQCDSLLVFADADGDGYGNASNDTLLCDSILPIGYVYDNTDCNDVNATVNPNANEICSNGTDDNCNGQVDENCCAAPAGLATTNITNSGAQLNWNTVASATKYKVQWKRDSSGASWNIITVTAPNTTTNITGLLPNSKYKWKVRSICGSVKSDFSPIVKFTTLLKMGNEVMQDNSVSVYPNPFDQSATISFTLAKSSSIEIDLFDLTGRKLTSILSEPLEQGEHQIPFESKNLESGIYLLQLKLADEISIIKIVVQ